MSLSSVSVVLSSLLLRYFHKPTLQQYENQSSFRQWSLNKANDIIVHRGIDNLTIKKSKSRSLISSIITNRFSLLVTDSISAVKNAIIQEKKKATVFFSDQRSRTATPEEIELQITAL